MKKKAEYVFLADTFKDTHDSQSMKILEDASQKGIIDKHVYAFGDISLDNIKIAKELGFGGVVIQKDLWNKFDIHNELDYKDLINHFEKLRKAVS